jgi:ParB family chromosome partitioning protein
LAALLDENRLALLAKQYGIKKTKENESIGKLFSAYLRRAEESILGGLLVEITILHAATRQNSRQVLLDAATVYKVDADAIALKVKQEFAARDKAKSEKRSAPKPPVNQQAKAAKKSEAA